MRENIASIPLWVWILFVLIAGAELYFFLMQRSALEICRSIGLPDQTRFVMLPTWYRVSWLASGTKVVAAGLLAWYGSVLIGIIAFLATLLAAVTVPVPHSLFLSLFDTHLQSLAKIDPVFSSLLDPVRNIRNV